MKATCKLVALSAALAVSGVGTIIHADTCPSGAVYEVSTGFLVVVTQMGQGHVDFTRSGNAQPAVALDFFLPHTGDRGVIFGPQRSYMFATDLDYLQDSGFTWGPAPEDEGGFFRVMTDDGQNEMFLFEFQRCFS